MSKILLDTNILIHQMQPLSPDHGKVNNDIKKFLMNGDDLIVCPQVLRECYAVMTRPIASNGLGLSYSDANNNLQQLETTYKLINDQPMIYSTWKNLILRFNVVGRNAHDTNIAAFMIDHSIDAIYTKNVKDFKRFNTLINIIS